MKARTRNNHVTGKATAWDLGIARCWKIKTAVWEIGKVAWSIEQ